jgi:hypothetical protein
MISPGSSLQYDNFQPIIADLYVSVLFQNHPLPSSTLNRLIIPNVAASFGIDDTFLARNFLTSVDRSLRIVRLTPIILAEAVKSAAAIHANSKSCRRISLCISGKSLICPGRKLDGSGCFRCGRETTTEPEGETQGS